MRTALFVYEPSSVIISTRESGVELSSLDTGTVTLNNGSNARTLARGVYKIVSNDEVDVTGEITALDIVPATGNKENGPTPPIRAAQLVDPIGASTLQAFFAVPEAKTILNP